MKSLFLESGIEPITLNAIFNINFCDAVQWRSIEEQFQFACKIGRLLDVHCVIVLPSEREDREKIGWEAIRADTVRNLKKMADAGRGEGMRIAFEPVGARERCVRSLREAWEVVSAVDDPLVGLALDAYNLFLCERLEDVEDILQMDPERIFIVHVDDADAAVPHSQLGTFDRELPGKGAIDLHRFIGKLIEVGYKGPYSMEILNKSYWQRDVESLFRETYERTAALLEDVERRCKA